MLDLEYAATPDPEEMTESLLDIETAPGADCCELARDLVNALAIRRPCNQTVNGHVEPMWSIRSPNHTDDCRTMGEAPYD